MWGQLWQAGPADGSGAQCLLPQGMDIGGQGSPWYLLEDCFIMYISGLIQHSNS